MFLCTSPTVTTLRLLGFAGGVWGACVGAIAVSAVGWSLSDQLIAVAVGVGVMLIALAVVFHRAPKARAMVTTPKST